MNEPADRVRKRVANDVLGRTDDDRFASLLRHAEATEGRRTAERVSALDREWDTDRALEIEAAATGLLGLALGALLDRRYLALPAFVAASVLVHANTGRYPLMPVFRRLGLRTAREIERERYALKALRGDFLNTVGGAPADEAVYAAPAESSGAPAGLR